MHLMRWREVADGLLFAVAIGAAVLLAAALPHHACDTLTPLPWLRC